MPEKKKITLPKMTERRGPNTEASKAPKMAEPARTVTAARSGAGAVTQPIDSQKQLSSFEAAMKLFHARKLKEARDLFLQSAQGPERDVAQRSRLHVSMCEQRLQQNAPSLRSAEDFYNYGIALLNTRRIDDARTHLEKALQMTPDADHVLYALAVAQALAGDSSGAHEHLRRAIELEPKNRLLARQDGDFSSLSGQAPFQALLYPEKKNW